MKKAKELIGSSRSKELHKIIKCIASRFDYMKKFEPKRKKTQSLSHRTPAHDNLHNNAARVLLLGLEWY
jgi:hypothetical protein